MKSAFLPSAKYLVDEQNPLRVWEIGAFTMFLHMNRTLFQGSARGSGFTYGVSFLREGDPCRTYSFCYPQRRISLPLASVFIRIWATGFRTASAGRLEGYVVSILGHTHRLSSCIQHPSCFVSSFSSLVPRSGCRHYYFSRCWNAFTPIFIDSFTWKAKHTGFDVVNSRCGNLSKYLPKIYATT